MDTHPNTSLPFRPIVIGHRGAAGYRLENTLASFEHAIDLGADFIELDLVCTKDGMLVARHDNALAIMEGDSVISGTTDVAERPEFLNRKTTKTIEGSAVTGWFTEDFTLTEITTLRCREQYPQLRPDNTVFDGLHAIPTLREIIDLISRKSAITGRTIGIFAESKHPGYFREIGLPYEELLLDQLAPGNESSPTIPIFIESFDADHLKRLAISTSIPLVQLIGASEFTAGPSPNDDGGAAEILSPTWLEEITRYAAGISIEKDVAIPRGPDENLLGPTSVIPDARALGLAVYVWTFRNENYFLPASLRRGDPDSDPFYLRRQGDAAAEYRIFLEVGVDGVFSDHPDTALSARTRS